MINKENNGFIPVLTTQAGNCLTAANWQQVGIKAVSFYLASLLLKPGYDFLNSLKDLASYVAWQDTLILNASLPPLKADGTYTLRSPYDGGRVHHSLDAILALIVRLQPKFVVLPAGVVSKGDALWQLLPTTVFPFFSVSDLPHHNESRAYGVYFHCDQSTSTEALLQEIEPYQHLPCYVSGDLSWPLMAELIANGVAFVESDLPAADACLGRVYNQEGTISLQDNNRATQFEIIEAGCQCPTCLQQFTQAYLHHLFAQTPLLCQRLLIQHNVWSARVKMK